MRLTCWLMATSMKPEAILFYCNLFGGCAVSDDCLDTPGFAELQAPLYAVHTCGSLHNDMSTRNMSNGQVKIRECYCVGIHVLHEEMEFAHSRIIGQSAQQEVF